MPPTVVFLRRPRLVMRRFAGGRMLPVFASRRSRAGRAMELVVYSAADSSGSVKFFLIITGLALVLGEYNQAIHPSHLSGNRFSGIWGTPRQR
jgi:hypothetical protein